MPTARTIEKSPETQSFRPVDWALMLFAALVWGGSFLFMAIALDHFHPGLVTALRVAFGLVTIWAIPAARTATIDRADWAKIAALGVTWMAFPLTLFPIAQQWINSSVAGMLNSAMPLMTTVLSAAVFSAVVLRRQLIGVLIGFAGILVISVPTASISGSSALGVALVVVAVGSYGVAVNIAGPLQIKYGSVAVVARALAVAAVLVTPYGAFGASQSSFSIGALVACVAAGAGGTGLAFVAAATLTGQVGAVRTSLVTYFIPVVAIVLGVVFRDEALDVWAPIGTVLILAGAYLASRGATSTAARSQSLVSKSQRSSP